MLIVNNLFDAIAALRTIDTINLEMSYTGDGNEMVNVVLGNAMSIHRGRVLATGNSIEVAVTRAFNKAMEEGLIDA